MVNEHTGEAVFRGTLVQRNNVTRLLTLRREHRRFRRYRLARHRPCRNQNRKQMVPFPSVRQKKEAVCRVLEDLAKIAPIGGVDAELFSVGINLPALEGRNAREKVLKRDGACVLCGSTERLQRHHIIPRPKGGTDTPRNQIALCRECHRKLHAGEAWLDRKGRTFARLAHTALGKAHLLALLSRFGDVRISERRASDPSASPADRAAILFASGPLRFLGPEHLIWPMRRRKWENNPTKIYEERKGFRHRDVVRAERAGKVVFGCVRSLKARAMTLRTAGSDNFEVSYSKAKLLHRPRGLAYVPVW